MIETITAILASPVLGGITGVIGTYLQKKEELKLIKEKNDHEFNMTKVLSENRIKETQAKSEADDKRLEGEAFLASQGDNKLEMGATIRSAARVVITAYLLVLVTWIGYEVNNHLGGLSALPEKDLLEIGKHLVASVLYLSTTAVVWWFGQRPTSTFKMSGMETR